MSVLGHLNGKFHTRVWVGLHQPPHIRVEACVREANWEMDALLPSSQAPSIPVCSLSKSLLPPGRQVEASSKTQEFRARAALPSLLRGCWSFRDLACWELRLEEAPVTSLLSQGHPGMVFRNGCPDSL